MPSSSSLSSSARQTRNHANRTICTADHRPINDVDDDDDDDEDDNNDVMDGGGDADDLTDDEFNLELYPYRQYSHYQPQHHSENSPIADAAADALAINEEGNRRRLRHRRRRIICCLLSTIASLSVAVMIGFGVAYIVTTKMHWNEEDENFVGGGEVVNDDSATTVHFTIPRPPPNLDFLCDPHNVVKSDDAKMACEKHCGAAAEPCCISIGDDHEESVAAEAACADSATKNSAECDEYAPCIVLTYTPSQLGQYAEIPKAPSNLEHLCAMQYTSTTEDWKIICEDICLAASCCLSSCMEHRFCPGYEVCWRKFNDDDDAVYYEGDSNNDEAQLDLPSPLLAPSSSPLPFPQIMESATTDEENKEAGTNRPTERPTSISMSIEAPLTTGATMYNDDDYADDDYYFDPYFQTPTPLVLSGGVSPSLLQPQLPAAVVPATLPSPMPTCPRQGDLTVGDGSAESMSMEGFLTSWGDGPIFIASESVNDDDGNDMNENHFFAQTQRSVYSNGIRINLLMNCALGGGMEYTFRIRYRLHGTGPRGETNDEANAILSWWTLSAGRSNDAFMRCKEPIPVLEKSGGWMECRGHIVFDEEKSTAGEMHVIFHFTSEWNLLDVDYDDIAFDPFPPSGPPTTSTNVLHPTPFPSFSLSSSHEPPSSLSHAPSQSPPPSPSPSPPLHTTSNLTASVSTKAALVTATTEPMAAPASTPPPTCHVMVGDGTAESGSMEGFDTSWGTGPINITSDTITGNHYFAQNLRNNHGNGIKVVLNPTCMQSGEKYTFVFIYRLHGQSPNGELADVAVAMLSWSRQQGGGGGDNHAVEGDRGFDTFLLCLPSTSSTGGMVIAGHNNTIKEGGGWVQCLGNVTIDDDKAFALDMHVKIIFKSEWNLFDVDYDNIDFFRYQEGT